MFVRKRKTASDLKNTYNHKKTSGKAKEKQRKTPTLIEEKTEFHSSREACDELGQTALKEKAKTLWYNASLKMGLGKRELFLLFIQGR